MVKVSLKAGIEYTTNAGDIDQEVATQIEKEVMLQYRLAQIFREIQMNSQSMVLPLQNDVDAAIFATTGENAVGTGSTTGLVTEAGGTAGTFEANQIILQAHRMISTTFMDNHIDEEVLVNLMPMMTEKV